MFKKIESYLNWNLLLVVPAFLILISLAFTIKAEEEYALLTLKKVDLSTIYEEFESLRKELGLTPLTIPPKE